MGLTTRLTQEQFIKRVKLKHGNKYTVLGTYVNQKTKILVRCNKCDNIWNAPPAPLYKRGTGCPKCGLEKAKETIKWGKAIEEFPYKLHALHGDKFILLTRYISRDAPIGVHCTNCQNTFTTTPTNLLRKTNHGKPSACCPFCGKKNAGISRRKSHEDFIKEIYSINPDIELLEKYTTNDGKVEVKCLKCGFVWKVRAGSLRRRGCPNCPTSKAELKIANLLQKAAIVFKRQVWFRNLRGVGGRFLRFDFGVYEQDKLQYLIEYDGWHHFHVGKFRGGEERFEITQQHDDIKNYYCEKWNIPLIRLKNIPVYKITLKDLIL